MLEEKGVIIWERPSIFICDDEPLYCEEIHRICEKTLRDMDISEAIITEGYDGKSVFEYRGKIDILILDIDMPKMDGIQVKNELHNNRSNCAIIYVTNHEERMREAFGKQVHGFVDKMELQSELPVMLKQLLEDYSNYVMIHGEYKSRDIRYIEAARDFCKLYFCDGREVLVKDKISKVSKLLSEVDFVLINRSCLVNMRMAEGIRDNIIRLYGAGLSEIELKISVRKKKEVLERWNQYKRKRMGYV